MELAEGTGVSWSPDGAWIGYLQDEDIKLVSPNGGPSRTLVTHAKNAEALKWSPDSAYVLTGYESPTLKSLWAWGDRRVVVMRESDGAELTMPYPIPIGIREMDWIRLE